MGPSVDWAGRAVETPAVRPARRVSTGRSSIAAWPRKQVPRSIRRATLGCPASGRTGVAVGAVEEAILDQLDLLTRQEVPPEELARVKRQAKAQFVYARDGVHGLGYMVGFYAMVDRPDAFFTLQDRLEQVTAADVQRAAAATVTPRQRTVGWYLPQEGAQSAAPAAAVVPPVGHWRAAAAGAEARAPPEILPGAEVVGVAGRMLREDVSTFLRLVGEVLTAPSFPAAEVEKARGELLTALRVSAMDTRYVAEQIFRRLAFPPGHPHAQPPAGDERVVEGLDAGALAAFHDRYFRPARTILVLVGDLRPDQAVAEVEKALGSWTRGSTTADPAVPAARAPAAGRRETVALPGKSQSDIVVGGVAVDRRDPAYYAVALATYILGGLGMMGRVGERVRETMGMAYYAHVEARAGLLAGPWWARAGVHPSNVQRAVDAIVEEGGKFQREGPTPGEVWDARGNNRSASIRESHRGDDVEGAVDVKRGEVWWVEFPEPMGRRPAVLVSRDEAYRVRGAVTVVPLTQTIRRIPVEVPFGRADGVPRKSVANADTITTVPKSFLLDYLTTLSAAKLQALEQAIKFALDLP